MHDKFAAFSRFLVVAAAGCRRAECVNKMVPHNQARKTEELLRPCLSANSSSSEQPGRNPADSPRTGRQTVDIRLSNRDNGFPYPYPYPDNIRTTLHSRRSLRNGDPQ